MGRFVTCTLDPDAPAMLSKADREYHDSLSDEELEDAARTDPDNPPATAPMAARAEAAHTVRRVRAGTGLSQTRFAARYGFSAAAVRDWELGTANAGSFHPVLPARHRARAPGGPPRARGRLTGARVSPSYGTQATAPSSTTSHGTRRMVADPVAPNRSRFDPQLRHPCTYWTSAVSRTSRRKYRLKSSGPRSLARRDLGMFPDVPAGPNSRPWVVSTPSSVPATYIRDKHPALIQAEAIPEPVLERIR